MVDDKNEDSKFNGKQSALVSLGAGDSHMKGVEMLVGNFELNPQRRPIWAWPKPFFHLKKRPF